MKKFKVLISIVVAVVILALSSISAFAVPAPHYIGDANTDREIDITDATAIQKYAAGILTPTKLQAALSDIFADEEVNIKDASLMQKIVAGVVRRNDVVEGDLFTYTLTQDFRASFSSDRAMVGTPVTFEIDVESPAGPLTYEYYINEVLVRERSEDPSFTYTFESAGRYNIDVITYNKYDEKSYNSMNYYGVVEAYTSETPVISMVHMNYPKNFVMSGDEERTITVDAIFGEAPYEFKFKQYFYDDYMGERTLVLKTSEFSSSNEFILVNDHENYKYYSDELLEITVRDASGAESTITYYVKFDHIAEAQ